MYHEIESHADLQAYLQHHQSLYQVAIQGLDLRNHTQELIAHPIENTFFLGCRLSQEAIEFIQQGNNFIFPFLPELPYQPFRPKLYSPEELLQGYEPGNEQSFAGKSTDGAIYRMYKASKSSDVIATMTQRLHDHAIDDALEALLAEKNRKLKVVGIMGGHSLKRHDSNYKQIAELGYRLTQEGYFVATGGGPGAMEAGNLGAYMSHYDLADLHDAIDTMKAAPTFRDPGWFESAIEVKKRYPSKVESLGVPTWFYGHEPSNLFASHHAKYFANSIREDGLLRICHGGVIYAPGSAGTIQEIFQDACQNHYCTCTYLSAMIFLDREYWSTTKPVFPLLQNLATGRPYGEMLAAFDDIDEVISFLKAHPPVEGNAPH